MTWLTPSLTFLETRDMPLTYSHRFFKNYLVSHSNGYRLITNRSKIIFCVTENTFVTQWKSPPFHNFLFTYVSISVNCGNNRQLRQRIVHKSRITVSVAKKNGLIQYWYCNDTDTVMISGDSCTFLDHLVLDLKPQWFQMAEIWGEMLSLHQKHHLSPRIACIPVTAFVIKIVSDVTRLVVKHDLAE